MAKNRSNNRGSHNNNPTGRNQYSSDWGVMEIARDRPLTATAIAAGAAAAGLFLWSRRSQISGQLSDLSDQIGEWSHNMNWSSGTSDDDDTAGLTTDSNGTSATKARGRRSSAMRETSGSNASFSSTNGDNGSIDETASGHGRTPSPATS